MKDVMTVGGRLAVVLVLLASHAVQAATLRPMTDESLVASSDLIVLGTVEAVSSGEWRGRIVTWTDITIERSLKGQVEGASIRLTEAGGKAGTRHLVIPGAPRYTPGEQVVVFARTWSDGLLRTNSFGLGKYVVRAAPGGDLEIRRSAPMTSPEALDGFLERIESLVVPGPRQSIPNGRTDDQPAATAAPFQLGLGNPPFRGRWFEADCGVPVELSLQNVDPILGDALTREVVTSALGAWTLAPEGSIELTLGADTSPSSSDSVDGINSVIFEDPFDEILDDLVACGGVLAVGGFFASEDFGVVTIAGNDFGRSIEGFIIVNEGVSACIDSVALSETLAHEVGHLVGMGHSSENPAETDPLLENALMFFQLHDDGRGAMLQEDDLAGLAVLYEPFPPVDPISDAVFNYACQYGLGGLGIGCSIEASNSPDGTILLRAAPIKKYEAAAKKAARAVSASTEKKQAKLVKKSCKLACKSRTKVSKLFQKGKFPQGCYDDLFVSGTRALEQAEDVLALIDPASPGCFKKPKPCQ